MLTARADGSIIATNWDDIRKLGNDGIILANHGFSIVDILHKVGGLKIDDGEYSAKSNLEKLLLKRGRFYCHRSLGMLTEIQQAGLTDTIQVLQEVMLKENFSLLSQGKSHPIVGTNLRPRFSCLAKRANLGKFFRGQALN